MRMLALLTKSAAVTSLTVLLQLATTANGFADNLLPASNQDTTNCITVGKATKLETKGEAGPKRTLVVRSTQITKTIDARSMTSRGLSRRAGQHDYQALTSSWKQLSQSQINNYAQRSWVANFHNEFRQSWKETEQRYALRHYDPVHHPYQIGTR